MNILWLVQDWVVHDEFLFLFLSLAPTHIPLDALLKLRTSTLLGDAGREGGGRGD